MRKILILLVSVGVVLGVGVGIARATTPPPPNPAANAAATLDTLSPNLAANAAAVAAVVPPSESDIWGFGTNPTGGTVPLCGPLAYFNNDDQTCEPTPSPVPQNAEEVSPTATCSIGDQDLEGMFHAGTNAGLSQLYRAIG